MLQVQLPDSDLHYIKLLLLKVKLKLLLVCIIKLLMSSRKKQNEYKDNIDKLIKAIEDNNRSEGERLQAFEALKAEYPTILDSLLTEAEYLKEIAKYKSS